jgi:hypothetical protein
LKAAGGSPAQRSRTATLHVKRPDLPLLPLARSLLSFSLTRPPQLISSTLGPLLLNAAAARVSAHARRRRHHRPRRPRRQPAHPALARPGPPHPVRPSGPRAHGYRRSNGHSNGRSELQQQHPHAVPALCPVPTRCGRPEDRSQSEPAGAGRNVRVCTRALPQAESLGTCSDTDTRGDNDTDAGEGLHLTTLLLLDSPW